MFTLLGTYAASGISAQVRTADSLKQQLRLAVHDTERVRLLNEIASVVRNSHFDTSMNYAAQAKTLAERIRDTKGTATALLLMSVAKIYQEEYSVALDLSLQALKLHQAIADSSSIAAIFNNIGYLYKIQDQFDDACIYFERARQIYQALRSADGLTLVLGNLADVALQQGNLDQSRQYALQAVEYGKQGSEQYYYALALHHLGKLYAIQRFYDKALVYHQQALAIFTAIGSQKYVAKSLSDLARLALAKQQYDVAMKHVHEGIAIAQRIGAKAELRPLYLVGAEILAAQGKFKQALDWHTQSDRVGDSIQNMDIRQRIRMIEAVNHAEQQQQKLALLEQERRTQLILRNALFVGFGLAAALLFLAINRYRLKDRSERELTRINAEILSQRNLLEAQARQIQEVNVELASKNLEMEAANQKLDAANEQLLKANAELDLRSKHLEQANKRLGEVNERLVLLDAEKNDLLGIVAHDLKNPLAGIMLGASTLKYKSQTISTERLANIAASILLSSERMVNLINNLLDLNALERGSLTLQPTALNLVTLVEMMYEQHTEYASTKSITLTLQMPAQQALIYADRNAVLQVIDNLVSNAIKYSPPNTTVVLAVHQVLVSQHPEQHEVVLSVKDHGPGLTAEDQQRLFTKFLRLSARPTGGEQSSGLGLSIAKKLVDAMHGRIWCESDYGHGATFFVAFPLVERG
jgi:signal transduction histidine kinase